MLDPWLSGEPYEAFMGRWSRSVAARFLSWLALPGAACWLDVGCGTGELAGAILRQARPAAVIGIDYSAPFIAFARQRYAGEPAAFLVSDGSELPFRSNVFSAAVSGLALNFFPRPELAVAEMARVIRPGGQAAVYVWDYLQGMQMLRLFWDAAVYLDPQASSLDEARRFPLCQPAPLAALFLEAGLTGVEVVALDVPTRFTGFDDFWKPLLGGVGPVPGYVNELTSPARDALRERLRVTLPRDEQGAIILTARAWAVRAVKIAPG